MHYNNMCYYNFDRSDPNPAAFLAQDPRSLLVPNKYFPPIVPFGRSTSIIGDASKSFLFLDLRPLRSHLRTHGLGDI